MKIGITGQDGFIGSHLSNYIKYVKRLEVVPFQKSYFENFESLKNFVSQCDVIVHLAALNRHPDESVIFDTNVSLVNKLIEACDSSSSKPHILFSSSTQEYLKNNYGNSKEKGRTILENWALNSGAKVSGLIIPNVFGPFGKPNYNSFIATFCYKINNKEIPIVQNDSVVKLIYVNELLEEIYQVIEEKKTGKIEIFHRHEMKVSDVLEKLNTYFNSYNLNGQFPSLDTPFDLALFTTYLTYLPKDFYPRPLKINADERGVFVETVRSAGKGQSSYSTTVMGITRGNHFHTRKAERFAVIKGKARIKIRKINETDCKEFIIDGNKEPAYVDMPIWHTHNITNIGDEELFTIFWINEPYDPTDPDTYFLEV